MRDKLASIPYFFFSQALSDGIRITFSILAPVIFLRHVGHFEEGLAISLGAICANIPDIPGPMFHKRNGLFFACGLIFISSLISGVFHYNIILTGIILAIATFIFTMFAAYGVRASAVGSAALLVMILSLNNSEKTFHEVFVHSFLILGGALWYSCISLLLSTMRPYRMTQRALGDCIRETAKFLMIKANFYDLRTRLEINYRDLLAQQVIVNEKQDALRELLYKTRQIVKDTNGSGRILMLTFVECIDLYEQITASYYNYQSIRQKYKNTGMLERIASLIRHMSLELNNIGFAIQSNLPYRQRPRLAKDLEALRQEIETAKDKYQDAPTLIKLTENLDTVYQHIIELSKYFDAAQHRKNDRHIEHKPFINHQDYTFEVLKDNLTLNSSAFRHSLRVTIACIIGFTVAHLLNNGHHGYWILITVVFIMKPAFSLTKKRNIQRLAGTATGGIIGLLILHFFNDPTIEFIFLLVLMLGTYTFMRINYIAMVIFTTPYVLILFKLLGTGYVTVIQERIIDTGIGCAIALVAGYLLFPKWEAEELEDHLQNVLKANLNYLNNFVRSLSGSKTDLLNYKIARKEVFLRSANLSAAFQRMLSEPKKKRNNSETVHEFVVLNHILSSNIAGLSFENRNETQVKYSEKEMRIIDNIQSTLRGCLNGKPPKTETEKIKLQAENTETLEDQLEFILYLCVDISKARRIISKEK